MMIKYKSKDFIINNELFFFDLNIINNTFLQKYRCINVNLPSNI